MQTAVRAPDGRVAAEVENVVVVIHGKGGSRARSRTRSRCRSNASGVVYAGGNRPLLGDEHRVSVG